MSESLAAALALIGIVILVSSLLSGLIERTGVPQVAIFLLVGAVLGTWGLSLVHLSLESPTLHGSRRWHLCWCCSPTRSAWTSARFAVPGDSSWRSWAPLLCSPLADRRGRLAAARPAPAPGCHAGRRARHDGSGDAPDPDSPNQLTPDCPAGTPAEGGINDVDPVADHGLEHSQAQRWQRPPKWCGTPSGCSCSDLHWAPVGYVAITVFDQVRSRVSVRRDYESLYALGVAFTAYAAPRRWAGAGSWRRSRRES